MSYDPTQQVPPPPPQGGYSQQGYPQQQGYTQQDIPPGGDPTAHPPTPPTYQQDSGAPPPALTGSLWRNLGKTGLVCVISGVVLLISFFFTWYSESISCNGPQCTDHIKTVLKDYDRSASGWGMANGGIALSLHSSAGTQSFNFVWLWVVILASLALMVWPILGATRKLAAQQTPRFVLITAGLALLIEVVYMFSAFASLAPLKYDINQPSGASDSPMVTGPGFGFWLGLLATLVAGGVSLYFGYIKKPAMNSYVLPYQQVNHYPGSQPYQPPSQYQQPGQYPGQQPPYPGQ